MAEDGDSSDATMRVRASEDEKAAESRVQEALQTGAVDEAKDLPEDLRFLTERSQAQELELRHRFAGQEYELRRNYATGLSFSLPFSS
jgi:hypothetical protein